MQLGRPCRRDPLRTRCATLSPSWTTRQPISARNAPGPSMRRRIAGSDSGLEKVAHLREVGFKFGRWIDVGYWQRTL